MRKLEFLVDCDEVLTAFVDRLTPFLSTLLGPDWREKKNPAEWDVFNMLNQEQEDLIYAWMGKAGYAGSFEPYPEALLAIEKIRQLGCEIYAVTSPCDLPTWCYERTAWLKANFEIPKKQIIFAASKFMVGGDFFLDDRPQNVAEWAERHPNGVAMLWTTEFNREIKGYDEHRVYNWDEVLEVVAAQVQLHSRSGVPA